jgi:hypothetical protein
MTEEASSWGAALTSVAACGGAGALIDFWIGKRGQQRVKDWMETWWLRLSDVRWDNVGREEARFAVRVMDRLFGRRLFSVHRLLAVSLAAIVTSGGIMITLFIIGIVEWYMPKQLFSTANVIWLAYILLSFAMSLSLMRFASATVAQLITKARYFNLVGLLLIFSFQWVLLQYWAYVTNIIRASMYTFFVVVIQGVKFRDLLLDVSVVWLFSGIAAGAIEIRWFFPTTSAHLLQHNSVVYLMYFSALLSFFAGIIRLAMIGVFITSFFLKPLQNPIMTLFARIIESDKPVFTLLFGGTGAVVKAIQEVANKL